MQTEFAFDVTPVPHRRPQKSERLFFCVFPDPVTAARVARFRERFAMENGLGGAGLATDRLHVTLHHVRDEERLKSQEVYAAQLAGGAVEMPSFEVEFRLVGSLAGGPTKPGKPLVLRGEGGPISQLRKTLGDAMERRGLLTFESFVPHMTLLYDREVLPREEIEPIRFKAKEFALVHSERGLTRYHILSRWPLRG